MASTSFSNEERLPYIVVKKYKPPSYKLKPPSLLLQAHQHISKLEVWANEYLKLGTPCLKDNEFLWPILLKWNPQRRVGVRRNCHDYEHAKEFLSSLSPKMVNWTPWGEPEVFLPLSHMECLHYSSRRILLEGPMGRYWYLGERVQRQLEGDLIPVVPKDPPSSMRSGDKMTGWNLTQALKGVPSQNFLAPELSYEDFCLNKLMRPLAAGNLPKLSRSMRPQATRGNDEDNEEEETQEDRPPPLPEGSWEVQIVQDRTLVMVPITRLDPRVVPYLDPRHSEVPHRLAESYCEIAEGLRKDLLRMSISYFELKARFNERGSQMGMMMGVGTPFPLYEHESQPIAPLTQIAGTSAGPSKKRKPLKKKKKN